MSKAGDSNSNGSSYTHSNQSLLCSLCNVPYDDTKHQPKLLACHHSYCLSCLEQLSVGRPAFRCPECRKKTAVPEYGVGHLQTNFYVTQMQSIVVPSGLGQTPSEVAQSVCSKHMNQPLLFYCSTCMLPICMNCTVLDHDKNAGHHISDIATVFKSNQGILKKKLRQVEGGMEKYHHSLNKLKTEMSNLETAKQTAMKQIDETFNQLYEKLKQRQEMLKENVEQHFLEKKQVIVSHAQIVKAGTGELNACRQELTDGIETKDITDAIQLTKSLQTIGKVDKLCAASEIKLRYENNYIQFHFEHGLQEFISALQSLGTVTSNKALPSDVSSKTETQKCIASLPTTFHVLVKDGNGQFLDNYPITATITNQKTEERTILKPKHEAGGNYLFDFRPKVCGLYKMVLLFTDIPVWGSEQDVIVYPNNPVLKFGKSEGTENNSLYHPTSVAVTVTGNVYVADMGNKKIQVFDDSGKHLSSFSVGGSESTTYDIALNHATEEVICTKIGPNDNGQTVGNTIRVFGFKGEKKTQFSNREMKRAMFVDVNSKGQIIVADSAENMVYIYSKEGVPIRKFGSAGSKHGQFDFPAAVAIGKDDMILIADTKNNRIQVFNKSGKFLHQIGPKIENCKSAVEITAPRGVTANSSCVFVADSHNRILVIKYNGSLIGCIGSEGDAINQPYNLALTGDDHVLVADFKNNCVKKYKYK